MTFSFGTGAAAAPAAGGLTFGSTAAAPASAPATAASTGFAFGTNPPASGKTGL